MFHLWGVPPQKFRKPRVVSHNKNVLNLRQTLGEASQKVCRSEIQLGFDQNSTQIKQVRRVLGTLGIGTEDAIWGAKN